MDQSRTLASNHHEIILPEDAFITCKTDINSHLTYVNKNFRQLSGYTENELICQHYNIVRHDLIELPPI